MSRCKAALGPDDDDRCLGQEGHECAHWAVSGRTVSEWHDVTDEQLDPVAAPAGEGR